MKKTILSKLFGALALALPAFAAHAAPVIVFDNPTIVNSSGGLGSESDTIQASLAAAGHTVTTFTSLTAAGISAALAGQGVLVIPEQELGDLGNTLDAAGRDAIKSFVQAGGGLIISADYRDTLNEIFGFSLVSAFGGISNITGAAAGTAFAGGPASLPSPSATYGFTLPSLPGGALSIYANGTASIVTLMNFGAGEIVQLGWDWFDAAPIGSTDEGWLSVLDRAVLEVTPDDVDAVPEPSSIALLGLGLAGLARSRRRKQA